MNKFTVLVVVLFFIIVSGCNSLSTENEGLLGEKPPKVRIEINGKTYTTQLGTYCWESDAEGRGECVDTAGAVDLLKDEEPIQVHAGEKGTLSMDYDPKPNEVSLTQTENKEEHIINIKNNRFIVPEEKGVYFYDYVVWWMDEKEENTSLGDAHYVFVLEVK